MKKTLAIAALAAAALFAGEREFNATKMEKFGNWQITGDILYAGGTTQGIGATAEQNFTYDIEGEVFVWASVMTHGQNQRRTAIYINDTNLGEVGDEALKPGQKPGNHWVKLPAKAKLAAGQNNLKVVARHPYSRIAKVILTDDEAFDPTKPRVLKPLGDAKEYKCVCDLMECEDIGNWSVEGGNLCSEGHNAKAGKFVKMKIEIDAEVEQNVAVWAYVQTRGGKWRCTNLLLNGVKAGTVGDRAINKEAGDKEGMMYWEKCKDVVHMQKGKNILGIEAANAMARINKVIITNNPDFKP